MLSISTALVMGIPCNLDTTLLSFLPLRINQIKKFPNYKKMQLR
jgi:hypothetical protein